MKHKSLITNPNFDPDDFFLDESQSEGIEEYVFTEQPADPIREAMQDVSDVDGVWMPHPSDTLHYDPEDHGPVEREQPIETEDYVDSVQF